MPALLTVYLLADVGNGANSPAHMSLLYRHAGSDQRATIVSVNSPGAHAGAIVGHLTLLPLADVLGIPVRWGIAAAILLASMPLYLLSDHHPPIRGVDRIGRVQSAPRIEVTDDTSATSRDA